MASVCAMNHTPPEVLIHITLLPNVMESASSALFFALKPEYDAIENAAAAHSMVTSIL